MGTREKPMSVEEAILRRLIDECDAEEGEDSSTEQHELNDLEIKKLLTKSTAGDRFDID